MEAPVESGHPGDGFILLLLFHFSSQCPVPDNQVVQDNPAYGENDDPYVYDFHNILEFGAAVFHGFLVGKAQGK